jgi:hypothetical protein
MCGCSQRPYLEIQGRFCLFFFPECASREFEADDSDLRQAAGRKP